jgi:membrane dipeptidase
MASLTYQDHRADPGAWARELGVSREAVELYLASEVIDLHVDSFIWHRIVGYDLTQRHGRGLFGASFYSQVDLPRLREAQVGGAIWVVTTNPARREGDRTGALVENVARLRAIFESVPDEVAVVRTAAEYEAARRAGKHAAFFGVQGGNALDDQADALDRVPEGLIVRVTLVHLSSSKIGTTSSPLAALAGGEGGLSPFGVEFVRRLNKKRVFVDLAHIDRKGFFDAVRAHDRSLPFVVTHTGVSGVHPSWRNLDDEQLRAVADSGGTVGIMYHAPFLGDPLWSGKLASVVDHLAHVVRTVGDDHASLGSDWDGAIVTPRDMPTCLELPRLVHEMLRRGWREERVRKVLGGNFLRALRLLRG